MKKLLTITSLLFCVSLVFSQEKYTHVAGEVTMHELQMSVYDQDPDAEALVIYEEGDYRFIPDYTRGFILNMIKRVKIKILKQAGDSYANITIPFYYNGNTSSEQVIEIKGTTYNWEDGTLSKTILDSKNIFEERPVDGVILKKIALSNVRVGSVIEYEYRIESPFRLHMREWEFQKSIPVLSSVLYYRAMPYYEYAYIVKGTDKLDINESLASNFEHKFGKLSYKELLWKVGMENLPAFKDEQFITSENDYLISMNFQLAKVTNADGISTNIISTWKELNEDFLKDDDFGKYIKNAERQAKSELAHLDLKDKSEMEKLEIIINHLKSNYTWDKHTSKYAATKVSEFVKRKTGNSANINLFLIGLLKASGFDVNPIVLSTRKNGAISKGHPFRNLLNYVIAGVKIGDELHFIDATDPTTYFSHLPEHCMNVEGLVVKPKKEEEEWVYLHQYIPAVTHKEFKIKILPDDEKLEVDLKFTAYGQDAKFFRDIARREGKNATGNISDFLKKSENVTAKDSIILENLKELDMPVSFSFSANIGLEQTRDKVFINPFCSMVMKQNRFNQKNRKLPIDLIYLLGNKYSSEIEIPDGYSVEYIPKNISVERDAFLVKYNSEVKDNKIIVEAEYLLKDNLFPASSYNALSSVMNSIINTFSEMIVLTKETKKD